MAVISCIALLMCLSLPVMAIRVSSLWLGAPVCISTLLRVFISVTILPFFPTTCRPMPGGMVIVWVIFSLVSLGCSCVVVSLVWAFSWGGRLGICGGLLGCPFGFSLGVFACVPGGVS